MFEICGCALKTCNYKCVCVGGGGGEIIVIKYWPILRRSFLDEH